MTSCFSISLLITVLLIFFSISNQTSAQSDPYLKSRYLWVEYKKASVDSVKIRLLSNLASICKDFLVEDKLTDSISEISIQIAEKNTSPLLKVIAWNNYIESVNLDSELYYRKARDYLKKALQISQNLNMRDLEWRTLHNMVSIHLSKTDYDSAGLASDKAMDLAEKLDNPVFMVESYLDIGKCMEGKLKMIDAFHNYFSAQKLAEKINDKKLLNKCYELFSDFYNEIKTFDKAIEYKQKQQVLILANVHPVDSVDLMWTVFKMHVILSRFDNLLIRKNIEQVIDYSIRTNNIRLKNYEISLYRKHLIEADRMDELYRVFNSKYPNELKLLSINNKSMYYRLKAFFKIYERKYDSAYYYFCLAEQKIINDPNPVFRSNFYIRFGQFLKETGKNKEAIVNFTKAYELAESSSMIGKMEYMLTAARELTALYALLEDYKDAYYYSEKTSWLRNNISTISSTEKVNRMSLEYQIKLENEKRDIQLRQLKNEQYMMVGGIAFLFIISLLIYRNYRNQKISNRLLDAAKKKSDELLENILPHETAEELKIHGKARAKRFEEVTVMFTDFKDFTQISEKLSAEDLVEKINFYFSEFDRIISKYGIEKIKIIGDSYMCVGGLPISNSTHACDVVNAALELQAFMADQKSKRMTRNESFFELRIGIHTGPVIAGIVGLKKFAYDVWGDTVNTASRMENTGETGKVNISGSTYEKIKDRFLCTYRGKVKAKHKGEIDMYFVIETYQSLQ